VTSKNNPTKETFNFRLTSLAQKRLCLSSPVVGASDRCKEGHRFDSGRGLIVRRFLFHARHMLNTTDIYLIYNVATLPTDVAFYSLYNFTFVLLRKLRVRAILCVSGVLVSCSRSGTCV